MHNRPRVAFLIPIASRRRAKNWHLACGYFKQTLSSVINSKDPNYCVVVVGHEPPEFQLPNDPRFKFLSLDHPLPSQENGYWLAAIKDKMIKLAAAWSYAKSAWNPQYVMKLDWDDRVCGSCLLIRSDMADQTGPFVTHVEGTNLSPEGHQFAANDHHSLVPGSGIGTLLLNDSHQRYAAQFDYLGQRLATVPFNAAVCRIGHGNNAGQPSGTETARMLLGRLRRTRLLTPKLRKEFMLD